MQTAQILWCRCERASIAADSRRRIGDAVADSGWHTVRVSDLCGTAASGADRLRNAVAADHLVVIGCHPRAMRALLRSAGIGGRVSTKFFRESAQQSEEIHDALKSTPREAPSRPSLIVIDDGDDWFPWYPVIDRERCKNCGQCASFCLFGVYEEKNGEIRVVRPHNCKTHCPACARICPEAAILFPKHDESPINGEEITDEESVRARIRIDVDEILGDDVYAALAERRKKARGLRLRREALEKAKAERAARTGNPDEGCSCDRKPVAYQD